MYSNSHKIYLTWLQGALDRIQTQAVKMFYEFNTNFEMLIL